MAWKSGRSHQSDSRECGMSPPPVTNWNTTEKEQFEMSAPEIYRIKAVTIAVADQNEALAWYTNKLGFAR